MRETLLNGDNYDMRRVTGIVTALAVFALAACGGSSNKTSSAPTPSVKPSSNGGVVAAQPTVGRLGTATLIGPRGTVIIGRPGPLPANSNQPTPAQRNGVAGVAACTSTSANPAPSNLGAMSAAILCLLNSERVSHGLSTLNANGQLAKAAKGWANRMVAGRFFAHEAGASSPMSRIRSTGYIHGNWQLGENIAWGDGSLATPRAIVNGWMHSPGHRANILHGQFKDIGIGIRLGAPGPGLSGGAVYVTDFGKHS